MLSKSQIPGEAQEKTCLVCGRQTPYQTVYEKWGYPIHKCAGCGLGSTGIASSFRPEQLYDESYFQGGQKDGYADYVGSEAVLRAEFRRALDHLRSHGCDEGKLLEIGCAFGYFLTEARKYFQCTGIEISEVAVLACRARGLEVFSPNDPDIESVWSRSDSYAATVMLDCIEHLADPTSILRNVRRVLAPDGLLMISTGDWDSLLARAMGKRWRLMTPPQHLFFFSPETLGALLERYGFQVVDCVKPWKMVPLGLAAYQAGNRLGIRLPSLERLNTMGVPVNLFDTFRMIARKVGSGAGSHLPPD